MDGHVASTRASAELFNDVTAAASPAPHALVGRLLATLQATPAHPAVIWRAKTYTNGQLLHKALLLAEALRTAGIVPGDRVAVAMERAPEALAALLACWCCAAVYVPLDIRLPRERLRQMVEHATPRVLLSQPALEADMAALPVPLLLVLPLAPVAESGTVQPDGWPAATLTAETPAYLMFTSGSSGHPKGVVLSHGNLQCFMAAVAKLLAPAAGCRVLGAAACGFDIALFEWLAPLLFRGTLVLADQQEQQDPAALQQLLTEHQVDIVQATPSLWQLLLLQGWAPPQRFKLALSIGEALPKSLAEKMHAVSMEAWNLYGPTECTIWATAHHLSPADWQPTAPATVCLGTALPGYGASGLEGDDWQQETELLLSGPAVAVGYWRNDDLTAQRFRTSPHAAERYYHTGDRCRRDNDGNWHFLGRHDGQVKWHGHRIELDEIATLLARHSSIAQAACLLRPLATDPPAAQLLACIVCKPGTPNKNAQSFNRWLATQLPSWMLPQRYLVLDRLPLTANGKLDQAALLALANEQTAGPQAIEGLARDVAAIFCEILELPAVGLHDSFFDLGGSSMLSATLVLAVNQRFGSRLSLRQVLQSPPTVSTLTALLQAAGITATASAVS